MKIVQDQAIFILVLIPILLLALVIIIFSWEEASVEDDERAETNLIAKNPIN